MAKEKKNVAVVAKAEAIPSYKPLLIADRDFDTLWYARSKEVKVSKFVKLRLPATVIVSELISQVLAPPFNTLRLPLMVMLSAVVKEPPDAPVAI